MRNSLFSWHKEEKTKQKYIPVWYRISAGICQLLLFSFMNAAFECVFKEQHKVAEMFLNANLLCASVSAPASFHIHAVHACMYPYVHEINRTLL